jgi:outer membrane murein-binding lipoprotein Lpp
MSAFQGVSMFFIQLHAEHVYNEAASARLRAEIDQQLKDAQAALDESGRALQEIEDLTTGRPDHN